MRHNRPIAVLVFVIVVAVMGRLCVSEFTWFDDSVTLHKNPAMNPPTLRGILQYWTLWGRAAPGGLYTPFTYTIWGALAQIAYLERPDPSGMHLNPWVFHTANVLLHGLSAVTVFSILGRLLGSTATFAAAAGALLFALHPVQVEPVGWPSGTKDVLCGLLSLNALRQYLLFVLEPNRRRARRHFAFGLVFLMLGMLSKPAAMVTPGIALMVDWLVLRRPLRAVVVPLLPWFGLVIPCMIWTKLAQPATNVPVAPLLFRPLIALDSIAFYFYKVVVPLRLTVIYGRTPIQVLERGWLYYTWLAPIVLFGSLLWWGRRRHIALIAAAAIFTVGVSPVLGFTPFLFQYYSGVADHYLYLSMFGVGLAGAYGVAHARPIPGAAISTLILVALSALTVRQSGLWQDELRLWEHNARVNPSSTIAHNHLGLTLYRRGILDRAEEHFRRAIELNRDDALGHNNLAMLLAASNRQEEAVHHIERVLQLGEAMPPALRPRLDQSHLLFGMWLLRRGEPERAAAHFRAALAENPSLDAAHLALEEAQRRLAPPSTQPVP